MKKPTKEQIQWFWEQCGFRYLADTPFMWFPDGTKTNFYYEPPIDLNNLFQYAVPFLQDKGNNVELYGWEHKGYIATVYKDCFSQRGSDGYDPFLEPISQVKDDDPALALFWAIYKALRGKK